MLEVCISSISSSVIIGIDTETTGLDPLMNKIRLLQVAISESTVIVIDLWAISLKALERLYDIFDTNAVKVFQNAKFDIKFLIKAGFIITGPIFDTMLAAQLVKDNTTPRSSSLASLVDHYLNIKLPKEEQKSDWSRNLTKAQIEYSAKDAAVLLPLRERLLKDIKENKLIEVCSLEFDCVWAVVDMELSGIELHRGKWDILYEKYLKEQSIVSEKLVKELSNGVMQINLFGEEIAESINLDSQLQLLKALKEKGINLKNTSHGELMEQRDKFDIIKSILEYRRVSKAIQGFLAPIPNYISTATGRIHSSYMQIGASSGRFSCVNPNIQQIPRGKEFRECFVPHLGNKFIIADYSQIELRVAAEIANDRTMIEAYKHGQDLHALTAALIANKSIEQISKKERQAAKAVNFGLIYAMGAKGLQGYAKAVYGIDMPLEEAETFRERFFKAYSGIANWHSKMKRLTNVSESRTLSGRRCVYAYEPPITALLNTPVQGTSADITKKALGMLTKEVKKFNGSIIATVHDEILLEVPEKHAQEAAIELKLIMEKAGAFYLKQIPVVADTIIADSWAEK